MVLEGMSGALVGSGQWTERGKALRGEAELIRQGNLLDVRAVRTVSHMSCGAAQDAVY